MQKYHSPMYEFEVSGDYALFSDPITRVGGEKLSYQVPTYEALKGIVKAIYWKPTMEWYIDAVRVMNPIRTEARGIRLRRGDNFNILTDYHKGKNRKPKEITADLSYYTYLKDVRYRVRAYFEWNELHPEFASDRNAGKHQAVFERSLAAGGRHDICLGVKECQGFVEPVPFEEGEGAYDNLDNLNFGVMLHGLTYADQAYSPDTAGALSVRFWAPVMKRGVITFLRPEECQMTRRVRDSRIRRFPVKEEEEGKSCELDCESV